MLQSFSVFVCFRIFTGYLLLSLHFLFFPLKLMLKSMLPNCFRTTAGKTEHRFFFFSYLKIGWHKKPSVSVVCKNSENLKDSRINKNIQVT